MVDISNWNSSNVDYCCAGNCCGDTLNNIPDTLLNSLPHLDILTSNSSIPSLLDIGIDQQIPSCTNFNYYSRRRFHSDADINKLNSTNDFSLLHSNVRSLSANHDNLLLMLDNLKFQFSIIGLSEIKLKVGQSFITNIEIPGYNFICQPSLSSESGVGFYIKKELKFVLRDDLCESREEFESSWIEIDNSSQPNILCSIMYRHPNSSLEKFTKFVYSCLDKIRNDNKLCVILGDFNINLLNFQSHDATENFINTMGSYCYSPQILQPTRITHHSATLIDNIFFN